MMKSQPWEYEGREGQPWEYEGREGLRRMEQVVQRP